MFLENQFYVAKKYLDDDILIKYNLLYQ